MTPNVNISKKDNQTGVVKPGATGILAIIAPVLSGLLSAAAFADPSLVNTAYGYGHIHEYSAYVMPITKKPVICVGVTGSTAATYSTIAKTGGGSVTFTAR